MCGDIMSIWNVQFAIIGLTHHTLTLSVALINAASKREQLQSRSISRPTRAKYLNRNGLKAKPERCASLGIGKAKRASVELLLGLLDIRKRTGIKKPNGINNTGIVGVAQMLAIWIGKLYQTSLMHLIINARTAERLNELKLTTSNHCQKVARTILITYNHYANLVTLRKATDESYL